MEISSSTTAAYVTQVQASQPQDQARVNTSQTARSDGPDRENDGDRDDRGAVTATRGQNLNITA